MIRTQIYLTEQQRAELSILSEIQGKKQSELIREAIDILIERLRCSLTRATDRDRPTDRVRDREKERRREGEGVEGHAEARC